MVEYTHRKLMLTHTQRSQPGKELDGSHTDTRIRILHMFRNDRNGHPNVVSKFNYKHASAYPPDSDDNTYSALPALQGARWLPCEDTDENPSDIRQWQEW